MRLIPILLVSLIAAVGCADDEPSLDDEWGMDGPVEPLPPPGKEDGQYRKGPRVGNDTRRTQVWTARHAWDDRTSPAASAAGLAWPANSGLSWDEKFGRWIESLAWVPAHNGYKQTVELTTPWGKTLASPYLECAEMAMFLRITFAAWYELPFQLEAYSGGQRVYFGHYGVRTATARWAQTPEFAISYRDHTGTDWEQAWPSDARLRQRKLYGGTDAQLHLGPDAVFGTYLDEIHLNKRVGYFTALTINYLGSANLADAANTYNLVPDAVRAGDVLLERWQRNGIGHTLVVKSVLQIGEGNLDVTTISGSMPRRQGVRESGVASKSYFVNPYTGGPGQNSAGDDYARLGGGLKRFRITKNVGGYWTNTWAVGDEAHWINSTDYERIAARPATFRALLGQVSPEQQRDQLVTVIADARHHLQQYPASCAARERRENAFRELYELSARAFGQGKAEVDADHRVFEDRVFAQLEYAQSRTCCWNSTTPAMYEIIVAAAQAEQDAAASAGRCVAPTVFRAHVDGYQRWAEHAATLGRSQDWRAWSEDESCPQRGAAQDTEAESSATPFCTL